ncbi:MAG: tRNA glutamyl-Q(34) synthetase GluQRS [Bifidobacteriaceae bacterium]|nr:tRNA glutamyl-Q(34) synthetase GluQRS [Bifidobacteriaceae bacterium]
MSGGAGRYAPSPSSDLHLGNLRTAVVAYLAARGGGLAFRMRLEDLDERCRPHFAARQLDDLASLGMVWDGPVMRQSERLDVYEAAIRRLAGRGLTYECFCSRRDILEAPRAAHHPPGTYPGTCRDLGAAERRRLAAVKPPAIRLRAEVGRFAVTDRLAGRVDQPVDDFVLRRADGVVAYNLAVVVDDAAQGVTEVTRGDDLLASSGRQAYLAELLGLAPVLYSHVPLVYAASGRRLSKRDGALAGRALFDSQGGPAGVLALIARSLGLAAPAGGGAPAGPDSASAVRAPVEAGWDAASAVRDPAGAGWDAASAVRGGGRGIVEAKILMGELVARFDWERLEIGPWTA